MIQLYQQHIKFREESNGSLPRKRLMIEGMSSELFDEVILCQTLNRFLICEIITKYCAMLLLASPYF